MQVDSEMPDAATPFELDPPTPSPSVGRVEARQAAAQTNSRHNRADPYSLRNHPKPCRFSSMPSLKLPMDISTLSTNGEIRSIDNHSPPFPSNCRDETSKKECMTPIEPLSGVGSDVAQRLKGTVDKFKGFSLAERLPARNEQGAHRKQAIPAICHLVQEAKSFATTESFGEGGMHSKIRLSKSCNDMFLPPASQPSSSPSFQTPLDDGALDGATYTAPLEVPDQFPQKLDESSSPTATAEMTLLRAGSVDEMEFPAMSPVGFFTTPASPHSPAGRPRSGSQSPYRRTYSNSSKGVHLKQGILGKRKAESDDERDPDKRFCLNLSAAGSMESMDVQAGDL